MRCRKNGYPGHQSDRRPDRSAKELQSGERQPRYVGAPNASLFPAVLQICSSSAAPAHAQCKFKLFSQRCMSGWIELIVYTIYPTRIWKKVVTLWLRADRDI